MTFVTTMAICGYLIAARVPPSFPPTPSQPEASRAALSVPDRDREFDRAKRLLGEGAVDEAIAVLREVVQRRPGNADAHLLLGRALALVPEPTQALATLRRAVELRPTSAEAHSTLGTALARFADLAAARPVFEKALALDPRSAEAHVGLAMILAQQEEIAPAREHLALAIEIQGEAAASAYSHYLMAQILMQEGQPQKALQHVTAAIERRPEYAEAYLSRGLIERQLLDERGAFQAFQTAVQLSPDDPVSRSQLGAAYLRNDQANEAIPHLEHALRLKPDERSTRYQLCRALQLAGRTSEAKPCWQKISARMESELTAANMGAGQANNEGVELEATGNVAAALERYRTAVALDPFNTVFRRNLALALCRLGRWDDGIAELRKVLEMDPNNQKATRALYIAIEQARIRKNQ